MLEAFVQVADVIQAVGNAQQSVEIQRRAVAAADSSARNARLAYENGAASLLDLVDGEAALLSLFDLFFTPSFAGFDSCAAPAGPR